MIVIKMAQDAFDGSFAHYGVSKLNGAPGRGSGRYELDSGKNPRASKRNKARSGNTSESSKANGAASVKGKIDHKKYQSHVKAVADKIRKSGYDKKAMESGIKELFKPFSNHRPEDVSDFDERDKAAARLGIKAINKARHDDMDPDDKSDQFWFWYEDQTSGLDLVADFINQGYSKDDFMKLWDETNSLSDGRAKYEKENNIEDDSMDYYDPYPNPSERDEYIWWALTDGLHATGDYSVIEACEDIYNEEHSK